MSPGSISLQPPGRYPVVDQAEKSVGDHTGVESEIPVPGERVEDRGAQRANT
jgi:hypothetical protein